MPLDAPFTEGEGRRGGWSQERERKEEWRGAERGGQSADSGPCGAQGAWGRSGAQQRGAWRLNERCVVAPAGVGGGREERGHGALCCVGDGAELVSMRLCWGEPWCVIPADRSSPAAAYGMAGCGRRRGLGQHLTRFQARATPLVEAAGARWAEARSMKTLQPTAMCPP